MTEDEAKTKWCPQTFGSNSILTCGSVSRSEPEPQLCIGSACMAWRWETVVSYCPASETNAVQIEPQAHAGYCGLAGRP